MKLRWSRFASPFAAMLVTIAPLGAMAVAQGTKAASTTAAVAEDTEDSAILTVALAPLDTFQPNLLHLMRQAGAGAQGGLVNGMMNQYAAGLDRKRPAGLFIDVDDNGQPTSIVCLPLTDVDAFFSQLEVFGEKEDLGEGMYEFSFGPQTIYAHDSEGWLYVGQTEDSVSEPPEELTAQLAKMVSKHDLAIQLNPQNIPEELVGQVMAQMRDGFEQSMAAQTANMDEAEADASRATGEQMIKNLEEVVESTESLIIGIAINKKEQKTTIDSGSRFVEGSRFAKQMESYKSSKAAFGGLPQDGSMMTLQMLQLVAPEEVSQIENTLESSLKAAYASIEQSSKDPESAVKAKKFIQQLVDILVNSAKQGSIENAVNVTVNDALGIQASVSVADGKQVEALAKEIAAETAKEKGPFSLQVGTGTHKGVNLHKATFALPPEADDSAKKVFGEVLNISIGTSAKALHIALGKNSEADIKAAIDRVAAKPSAPAEMIKMRLVLSQLLGFIQSVESNPVVDGMIAAIGSGNDKIMVDSRTVERGSVVTITLEDGVLKAISGGVKAGAEQRGGGF